MSYLIGVTGANGFIGRALCDELIKRGYSIRKIVRSLNNSLEKSSANPLSEELVVGEINNRTDWSRALDGVHCLIHCAGQAHVINDLSPDTRAGYEETNALGTKHLAEQATLFGVRRLIYLSSIKVNGESSLPGRPLSINDDPKPMDAYAKSKWAAEQALKLTEVKKGLDVVVLRLPLVYGPGVKGNLRRLITAVDYGAPLPFMTTNNLRSMVGLDNLNDLIIKCIESSSAVGKTFFVSDGRDISIKYLLNEIALNLDVTLRLFPIPIKLIKMLAFLVGRSHYVDRLVGNLQINIGDTVSTLSWRPPFSVSEQIAKMVKKND